MADKVVQIQQDIKNKAEDYREFLADLKQWETDIKSKDAAVKKKNKLEADYPPVRGTVAEDDVLKMKQNKQKENPILRQKELGNDYFKKGKYREAVDHYAKGISLDDDDENVYVLHANSAMAYLKLEDYKLAEEQASKCIAKNRTYTKGFFRRALARKAMGKLKECIEDLNTTLVLEPDNKEAKSQLSTLQTELKNQKKEEEKAKSRKKLNIVEVDDDDDDDDDDEPDEVEIPIKKRQTPEQIQREQEKKKKEEQEKKQRQQQQQQQKKTPLSAHSFVEELDDDDEEEVVVPSSNKKHFDPQPLSSKGVEDNKKNIEKKSILKKKKQKNRIV